MPKLKTKNTRIRLYEKVVSLTQNQSVVEYAEKLIRYLEQDIKEVCKKGGIYKKLQSTEHLRYIMCEGWSAQTLGKKVELEIRINQYSEYLLRKITKKAKISDAITDAICIMAYAEKHNVFPQPPSCIEEPLFYLHGNKKDYVPNYRDIFGEMDKSITNFVDVFGGSGILTALASESMKFQNITYNDFDINKYKLIKLIATNPDAILCAYRYLNAMGMPDSLEKGEKEIFDSLDYCLKYQKNCSFKTIFPKFIQYSQLLNGIDVTNSDCVKIISKHKDNPNCLLMIDPPYRLCRGYDIEAPQGKNGSFPPEKHDKIDNLLKNCKATFLYCCRITAPRDYVRSDFEELDAIYRGMIDEAYAGKNLYFFDCEPKSDGTVERIISNHRFSCFKEYL